MHAEEWKRIAIEVEELIRRGGRAEIAEFMQLTEQRTNERDDARRELARVAARLDVAEKERDGWKVRAEACEQAANDYSARIDELGRELDAERERSRILENNRLALVEQRDEAAARAEKAEHGATIDETTRRLCALEDLADCLKRFDIAALSASMVSVVRRLDAIELKTQPVSYPLHTMRFTGPGRGT